MPTVDETHSPSPSESNLQAKFGFLLEGHRVQVKYVIPVNHLAINLH